MESGIVKSVTGSDEDFHQLLESPGAAASSRKILFATGMKDVLPNIEGLVEVYGTSAFVCPFCDGWELRDKHICVIAPNDLNLHFVKMISGWTKYVTLLTNGSQFLSSDQLADLELHGVYAVQDEIERIESIQGYVNLITFRSNAPVKCDGIFFSPTLIQSTTLPERLGCELSDNGTIVKIVTDPMGRTNVPGVYSAGDAAGAQYQLISAASSGATTAAAIQLDLLDIEWKSVQ
ncbi:NAD(P)/FAD-dependent oxidoreductase [Paenibacillus polymyxa]|uniref:NAD(P)/FAD-dependent oxidoreductase n=1 Tax=Paenibacillus polymyxa TaxID=1406 RepID=UPI0001E32250|nr:FAD-dependent oxidoreductase [Paenibacillus polymyxa]